MRVTYALELKSDLPMLFSESECCLMELFTNKLAAGKQAKLIWARLITWPGCDITDLLSMRAIGFVDENTRKRGRIDIFIWSPHLQGGGACPRAHGGSL